MSLGLFRGLANDFFHKANYKREEAELNNGCITVEQS